MKHTGRAYAFFDCSAPREKIARYLPTIRNRARVPVLLELSLHEGHDKNGFSQVLIAAEKAGLKYGLEASLNAATNRQVAEMLVRVLNEVYQFPLYDNEAFRGGIVYSDGKKGYVFRDEHLISGEHPIARPHPL
jgi:hypothetical protein